MKQKYDISVFGIFVFGIERKKLEFNLRIAVLILKLVPLLLTIWFLLSGLKLMS